MLDLGRFPYINADGKAVTAQTVTVGDSLDLDVKFNNTTDKNIALDFSGATDTATYKIVDNSTGAIEVGSTTFALDTAGNDVVVLKGKSVDLGTINDAMNNVGTFTIMVEVVDGTTTYDSEFIVTVKAVQADADAAAAVVAEINSLGSNPTKAAVEAARASYTGLTPTQQGYVTNLAKLVAFETDISNGGTVKSTIAGLSAASTNKNVADARAAYTALGALGKAEVDNLAALVTAETNLANAKTALANKIADAKALYNGQYARLNTFSAMEINTINAAGGGANAFDTYVAAVAQLNTDIGTAEAVDVDADATKLSDITGATTQLNTDMGTLNTAKGIFDAIPEVVATGK